MPSPFPGMDPYLEDPGLWPHVHHGLISELQATLNRQLRPRYHVRIEERVYISDENDPGRCVIVPDLRVAAVPERERPSVAAAESSVAVSEPLVATTLIEEEIHEARLQIVDREQRMVVTVIEVLSPTNKVIGSRGRASYDTKRREVMTSPSHLVEIDLLRAGTRIFVKEALPPHDYLIHVSRHEQRPRGLLWPIRLRDPLPKIPIPLKPEDADVPIDLQRILNATYDRAGYDLEIDYTQPPSPPIPPPDADWVRAVATRRPEKD